jgi:hypothetical protein
LFSETIVNFMGYEHMQAGDTKGAVEIMKLNAMANADSPNAYDSLADAYLADGQKDLARQNAQKALEHLVSDTTDPEERRKGIKARARAEVAPARRRAPIKENISPPNEHYRSSERH